MTNDPPGRGEPARAGLAAGARRTRAFLVLTLLALLALPAAVVLPAVSAAPAAAATRSLALQLTRVGPAAVTPETPLVVSGVARNTGTSAIATTTVTARLHSGLLYGRPQIDDWLAEDEEPGSLDTAMPGAATVKNLAAGATAAFTITVPAGLTGLGTANIFGPRGLALDAEAGNGSPLATLRTTFVWMPSEPTLRTRLSLAAPLTTATATTVAGSPTEDAAREFEAGGRYERIESATAADKAIAWIVDPAVLQAARRIGTDGVSAPDDAIENPDDDDPDATGSPSTSSSASPSPSGSPTAAASPEQTAASGWLSRFRSDVHGRGLIGLPYADPDLTATLRSKASVPLLTGADALARQAADEAAGLTPDLSVAWPANGRVNSVTAGRLVANGRTAVLLAADTQPPAETLSATPTGRSTIQTAGGPLAGLLYDDQLSSLFAAGGTAGSAAATQTLLAQLAAVTRESGEVRHLLAVAPRSWNPNPAGVRAMMAALRAAPWVSLRGINDLRSAEPTVARTAVKYGAKAKNAELPRGHISRVLALHRDLTTFAPALDKGEEATVVGPRQERLASLISVAWRSERNELVAARDHVSDQVDSLVDGVILTGARSTTVTGKTVVLPIFVDNKTPYALTAKLRLKSSSGQLTFGGDVDVRVLPNRVTRVPVPTRALANGNVRVEAKLLTSAGGQVGQSLNFRVRVRPSWETVGMIVVGSFLGLLFVVGLLRSIRRGKRRGRVDVASVPDVDEQASLRADAGVGSTGGPGTPESESDAARDPAMPRETR